MEKTKLFSAKTIAITCIIFGVFTLASNFFSGAFLILLGLLILPSTSNRVLETFKISKIKNVKNIAISFLVVIILISNSINSDRSEKKNFNKIEPMVAKEQNNINVATTKQTLEKVEIKEQEKAIPIATIKIQETTTTTINTITTAGIVDDRNKMIEIFKVDASSK